METKLLSNTDELFQKYTVTGIKKLRTLFLKEINARKDELRAIVGERYRDCIEVADKINGMKDGADGILRSLSDISTACSGLDNLVSNRGIGETEIEKKNAAAKMRMMSLIKLLIYIEDDIWRNISYGNYLRCSLMIHFSMHIRTVLTMENGERLREQFPFLRRLWDTFLKFPTIIAEETESKFADSKLNPSHTSDSFCALSILENLAAQSVLEKFLACRLKCLQGVINQGNLTSSVKSHVTASLEIIADTFQAIHRCFLEYAPRKADVYWTESHKKCRQLSVTDLMEIPDNLTSTLKEFKIQKNEITRNIGLEDLREKVGLWFSTVKNYVRNEAVFLLDIVRSLKQLRSLRESYDTVSEVWSSVCVKLMGKNANLWEELYEPLVAERGKTILAGLWKEASVAMAGEIEKASTCHETKELEVNLYSFLWSGMENDMLEKCDESGKRPPEIFAKSKGLSPASVSLCNFLEDRIAYLMSEFGYVCTSGKDTNAEVEDIKRRQRKLGRDFVLEILKNAEVSLKEPVSESTFLLLARFLTGIPSICSSLKDCLLLNDPKGEEWLDIINVLRDNSTAIWKKWLECVAAAVVSNFKYELQKEGDLHFQIKLTPKWQMIEIEEELEDGGKVTTKIRVPCQCSFVLQAVFNDLSTIIGRVLPPRFVAEELIGVTFSEIFDAYDEFTTNRDHHQNVYIQALFDVKCMISIFIPSESEDLSLRYEKLSTKLEGKIDAVDLDTSCGYVIKNVDAFVSKTRTIFGFLFNNSASEYANGANEASVDPHVIHINVVNTAWIPMLPTTSSTTGDERNKIKDSKSFGISDWF